MALKKSGNIENSFLISLSKWQIKLIFIFTAVIIVLSVVIYTRLLVDELIKREQNSIKLYTDIFKRIAEPDANIEDVFVLIDKIAPTISFPMISTDENDVPIYPYDQWTLNVRIDTSQPLIKQKEYIQKYVQSMKSEYQPIIVTGSDGKVLNKFYYTHSSLIDKFRLFPVIEIFIAAVFIFVGYLAFSNIRKNEESKVWVGMAKEAAHQLGTPLSSMLAWLEILKNPNNNKISVDETISEMENDINRLNIIATRFSKIGSMPEKKLTSPSEIIENVCNYFEKRLPHIGRKVEIVRNFRSNLEVELNAELFAWVIENLLKNSAEAIENKKGRVVIETSSLGKSKFMITVTDNGKGMTSNQRRQVFHPGFTTKKRGWGLGLSLCRRIIRDYHGGKIFIKESSPGKGTTFAIELPVVQKKNN